MNRDETLDAAPAPPTLWGYLDRHRRETPSRTALVHPEGRLNYADLCLDAEALALGLIDIGARPGDTISYQMPNWAETALIALATLRIGAICNPIVPIYRNREVSFLLGDARSRFVFMPQTYRDSALRR